MPGFTVCFDFIDITATPPPRMTDLLFFNAAKGPRQHYARGWVEQDGEVVLIGGQWKPTHYALVPDFWAALVQAGGGEETEEESEK